MDNHQIEELKRWQLLDFVPEPEEDYVSAGLATSAVRARACALAAAHYR